MNPENQQTPVTPQQPTAAPVPQPAASAQNISGITPPTSANIDKQKKLALILAIGSIAIFIGGLIAGYVFAAAAFLGAYAAVVGFRTKTTLTIVLGLIGLVLNFGLYTLSIFVK